MDRKFMVNYYLLKHGDHAPDISKPYDMDVAKRRLTVMGDRLLDDLGGEDSKLGELYCEFMLKALTYVDFLRMESYLEGAEDREKMLRG